MDPRLVQRTRYLLQARVQRAKSCPQALFVASVSHLLAYLRESPILAPIHADLLLRGAPLSKPLDDHVAGHGGDYYIADTLIEHAAFSLIALERIASAKGNDDEPQLLRRFAFALTGKNIDYNEAADTIRDIAVDAVHEWVDEKIDSRNVMLGLLIKYKHRTEWFGRARLRQIAHAGLEGRQSGERSLAVDLNAYVFDQGVEFSIEPKSASGEADLVLRDSDGSHVVMDAKYIAAGSPPSVFKRKLAEGFHQVVKYCHDFNEPAGYLVVFIADSKAPRLPLETVDGFSYYSVDGKQVYYIPVNIADAPSASKAGRAEEVVIERNELVVSHLLTEEATVPGGEHP